MEMLSVKDNYCNTPLPARNIEVVEKIIDAAKVKQRNIVLPEGSDERILEAANTINQEGIASITLLGDEQRIADAFASKGWNLDGIAVINPETSEKLQEYADAFHELRKAKGIDAVPVATGHLLSDKCQVIILPQMRSAPPPAKTIATLEAFVKQGGGLITTHDAVGYRTMPKLLVAPVIVAIAVVAWAGSRWALRTPSAMGAEHARP